MGELNKLFVYLVGVILGGIFIISGLLADSYFSGIVIMIGIVTIFCSLIGVGVHDSY